MESILKKPLSTTEYRGKALSSHSIFFESWHSLSSGRSKIPFPMQIMENASNSSSHQLAIGICKAPPHGIYELNPDQEHLDPLGSISASAIFALAEVSSHFFLIQNMDALGFDDYIPQMRSCRVKLRSKTDQRIYSLGRFSEREWKRFHRAMLKNHRGLIEFPIHVMNDIGKCTAIIHFEWFVFRKPKRQ